MTLNFLDFELLLLILVRVSAFIFTAPFFSLRNVPVKVKAGISLFLAVILFYSVPVAMPAYSGVIGYALLIAQEAVFGAIIGLFANIAYHILEFAGRIIDMEIGFSMVSELDPVTNVQTTITANFYGYLVLLIMIITDLHHYFLKALADSFRVAGPGQIILNPDMYKLMVSFITQFFIIGFRIVLPVFTGILLVNTVLGILAKIAPQMNMFVIGMQMKVMVGLGVLFLIIGMVPSVADFIFNRMQDMMLAAIDMMT